MLFGDKNAETHFIGQLDPIAMNGELVGLTSENGKARCSVDEPRQSIG